MKDVSIVGSFPTLKTGFAFLVFGLASSFSSLSLVFSFTSLDSTFSVEPLFLFLLQLMSSDSSNSCGIHTIRSRQALASPLPSLQWESQSSGKQLHPQSRQSPRRHVRKTTFQCLSDAPQSSAFCSGSPKKILEPMRGKKETEKKEDRKRTKGVRKTSFHSEESRDIQYSLSMQGNRSKVAERKE